METKKLRLSMLSLSLLSLLFIQCDDDTTGTDTLSSSESTSARANSSNKYIVVLKENSTLKGNKEEIKGKALGLAKKHSFTDSEIEEVYSNALQGFTVKLSPGQLKKLENDDIVSYIEKDEVIALAPITASGKVSTTATGSQSTPWGITRIGGAADGTGKTAWVIDSGIDLDHEDLNVDASRGFTAFTKGRDNTPDDGNGHGTHVAGTIAALDNSIGVIGVAPGATVVPVKVLNTRGSGSTSGVIAGIDYVAANGSAGDVANMSLGGGVSTSIDQAVINAASSSGVIFLLAAGNETDDANNHSPARANGQNIYTISASDSNDYFAYFSNYGTAVDYCAPGVSILSTWKDGGYNTISGTSMATPHAAGVFLLGSVTTDGYVNGDPDGNPDPIIHR